MEMSATVLDTNLLEVIRKSTDEVALQAIFDYRFNLTVELVSRYNEKQDALLKAHNQFGLFYQEVKSLETKVADLGKAIKAAHKDLT